LYRVIVAQGVVMADECCGTDQPESANPEDTEFDAAIEELAKHERRILAAVAKPDVAEEFLADPSKLLRRLKIPVPAAVAHRLRLPTANRVEDVTAQPVVLPNGQVITPKVTVHITGRKR
jgi:hypothetical protein